MLNAAMCVRDRRVGWLTAAVMVVCVASGAAKADRKTFCISGASDGVGWSWGIISQNGGLVYRATNVGVPAGTDANGLAREFERSISGAILNGPNQGYRVTRNAECGLNYFTISGPDNFQFWIGDAAGTPASGCQVTNNPAGCTFNPTVQQASFTCADPPVPAMSIWGLLALTGLVAGVGVVVLKRLG